jgi:hypothetical protein
MNVTNRLHLWFAAATLGTLLAACGGGGGGGDDAAANAGPVLEAPPATASALQASGAEASGAVVAAMDSAQRLVKINASLNGNVSPLGLNVSAPLSWSRAALSAKREQALATQTVSCADFFGTASCSGSLTIDTNANSNATVIAAGTYVSLQFNNLQGTDAGSPVALNGTLRFDYLTAFDVNAASLAGVQFRLTFTNLSGTSEGVAFGPITEIALYEFDSQGIAHLTIDGLRITGFDTLTVTDADNYNLPALSLLRAHWATPSGYVDLSFQNWSVTNGRPSLDSRATITAPNSSLAIVVTASSLSTVVYGITTTLNGVVSSYTVTASYPAGGGAPTYTVVATPT